MLSPKGHSGKSLPRKAVGFPIAIQMEPLPLIHPPPIASSPPPSPTDHVQSGQKSTQLFGMRELATQVKAPHPTSKGKSTTNKLSHDDLLQAGTGDLVKLVVDWLSG